MIRCLLIAALLAGCQHRDTDMRASAPQATAETKPAAAAEPVDPGAISGTVLETMDASTYTYVRLDRVGSEIWVAGPQAKVAVGTKLDKLQGQLMTDFYSKTLDRTFSQIYFISSFGAGAPAAEAHAAAPAPQAAGDAVSGTVVQTMEAGGYTYAELDQNGTKVWVAGPTTKLAIGTKLGKMSGSLMTAFHSNTLNRTFDQIYFVGSYAIQ
jgi:hypothetical protein